MKRKGRWKPLSGGSPKISNFDQNKKKKNTKRFAKVLACEVYVPSPKVTGQEQPRNLSVCKGCLFQSTVRFLPLWFFLFVFVRKHTKGKTVYKCVCVSEHHSSEKLWALIFPQTATRQPHNPFLQPPLCSTLCFPLKRVKPGVFIWNILYIFSSDLCIHTGLSLLEQA